MRYIPVCLIALMLSACSATMVTKRGFSKSPNAPTNEASLKGGTVKYLAQGYDSVIQSRREDAYKKMHETCNGPYKIVSESGKSDSGAAVGVPGPANVAVYGNDTYIYIEFVCER